MASQQPPQQQPQPQAQPQAQPLPQSPPQFQCRCHGYCACTPIVTTQATPRSAPSGLDELLTISGIPRKKRFGLAPNNNSAAIWSLLVWPQEDTETQQQRQLQELKDADLRHIREKVRSQIQAEEEEKRRLKQQNRVKNAKQLAIQKRIGMVPQHTTLDDDSESDNDDIPYIPSVEKPSNQNECSYCGRSCSCPSTRSNDTITHEDEEKEQSGQERKTQSPKKQKSHTQTSSVDLEQKYSTQDPIITALNRRQRIKAHSGKSQADEKFYAETNAKQDERRLKMQYFQHKFDEERKQQLANDISISRRDLPNSTISFQENKPVFHPFGNANLHPVSGGVIYGNYMASHNAHALSPRKKGPVKQVFEHVKQMIDRKEKQQRRAMLRHAQLQQQQLQHHHESSHHQQQHITKQQAYINKLHTDMESNKISRDDGYFVALTPKMKPTHGKRPSTAGSTSSRAILTR